MDNDDDVDDGFESGPYCQHWGDPSDCDEPCATCGHTCAMHCGERDGECRDIVNDCTCNAFVNRPDEHP